MSYMVEIDSNGRILIPAQLRKSYGFEKGDKLALIEEGEHVTIVKKTERLKMAQSRFAELFKDKPHVGVEDFLEFRREEAQLEGDA